MGNMLRRRQLEHVFDAAQNIRRCLPTTYTSLTGIGRLSILPELDEPVQSTLHQIIQQCVTPGTPCLDTNCRGVLSHTGMCSELCHQHGRNAVDDLLLCENCDYHGFPCPNCSATILQKQIKPLYDD